MNAAEESEGALEDIEGVAEIVVLVCWTVDGRQLTQEWPQLSECDTANVTRESINAKKSLEEQLGTVENLRVGEGPWRKLPRIE